MHVEISQLRHGIETTLKRDRKGKVEMYALIKLELQTEIISIIGNSHLHI